MTRSSIRRRAGALGLALLVSTLTACGLTGGGTVATPSSYPTKVERGSTLKIYSWADYISPDNIKRFEKKTGVKVSVDAYGSAEEAVAKLRLTSGTSGYDLVVMDGSYLPQLARAKAILPWDKKRLTGLSGVSKTFLGKSWDPTNEYGIPKSGGSTGYVWDSSVVTKAPTSWNDFYADFADPAVKGRTSVIDGAPSLIGSYFWGNGISDQTQKQGDYDHAQDFFADKVLPHLKEFNSYPRSEIASGSTVLAQAFTGDARGALMDGSKNLRFALGSPKSDLYVDHWVLPAGSKNIAAAHAFVNYLLDPAAAARETEYHGYYTGVVASRDELPANTPFRDIIFFDQGVPASHFIPSELTDARKQSVATFQRLKALASR